MGMVIFGTSICTFRDKSFPVIYMYIVIIQSVIRVAFVILERRRRPAFCPHKAHDYLGYQTSVKIPRSMQSQVCQNESFNLSKLTWIRETTSSVYQYVDHVVYSSHVTITSNYETNLTLASLTILILWKFSVHWKILRVLYRNMYFLFRFIWKRAPLKYTSALILIVFLSISLSFFASY